jgi:hypothetical protein
MNYFHGFLAQKGMHPYVQQENGVSRMGYKYIKGLEENEVPNKEELFNLLQNHDLYHRKDMNSEQLWDILATYFNARDEFITIARDPNKVERRQELLECMERLKSE